MFGHGFAHELLEVTGCLQAGLGAGPFMTPEEPVRSMEPLDQSRDQMGLRYPSDAVREM